jgi:hypothetical protein
MIDIRDEKPVPFDEVAEYLGVHPNTLIRWSTTGVGGALLESFLLGGRRSTTWAAVQRFVDARNGAAPKAPCPSPARRRKEVDQAERDAAALLAVGP